MQKRFFITLTILLLFSLTAPTLAYPFNASDQVITRARNYLESIQQPDGSIGGFGASAWVVMAITSLGEDPHNWKKDGGPSIVDYLKANANQLNEDIATDIERYILAMTAAGENPKNIDGKDYVAILEGLYDGTQIGDPNLLNDDFWGVIALISAGKPFDSPIIQNTVTFIKNNQNSDHGWSWGVGGSSDIDDTAAAIMALISAGESASSTVIVNALGYMKSKQMDNGGFESWGTTNPGTNSWAIDAIVAAGQDPTSAYWTKNGKTPVDDLLTFQVEDGAFSFPEPNPRKEWATSYAIPALLGKPYPIQRDTVSVGGVIVTVSKHERLMPWIGLALTIIAATVTTAVYVKRGKEKHDH